MLRFGVNYTPSVDWFYSWLDPDWDVVRRDMEAIADLGLDHVRVLPLWPVLQPNRTLIRPRALDDVRRTVELAGEAGLDASVDALQGHLSSFDFVPSWLHSWHARSMFADQESVLAQRDLVDALDERLHDLPNFLGLTLGNEVNQFTSVDHPTPMAATPQEVTAWLETLLDAPRRNPEQLRLHAEYDAIWYAQGHAFEPSHASRYGDVTAIHSWVFNGTAQGYGGMSEQSLRHAEYLVELSRAFAPERDKPVWLQEVGAPRNHISEDDTAEFCERTVRSAADSDALWGITWWCSHDVPRSLGDFPELEHTLGLFDETGTVKPIARRFGALAAELRNSPPAAPRSTAVVSPVDDRDTPLDRRELAPGGGIFDAWMARAVAGERPALVTSRVAAEPSALATTGITGTIEAAPTGRSFYSSVSDTEMFGPGEA